MATNSTNSLASTGSSQSSGTGPSRSGEDTDWKERCHMLEGSLLRFKQQASRIRDLLGDKVQELEQRTEESEKRTKEAEEKNARLEERLASMNWKPEDMDKKCHLLEESCQEKEQIISNLREQIEEQKELRAQETRLIEDKSAKIKDWVARTLHDFEIKKRQLIRENETAKEQLEILRNRLHALPSSAARQIHRLSLKESNSTRQSGILEDTPPVPKRPSSSIMDGLRTQRDFDRFRSEIAMQMQLGNVRLDLEEDGGGLEADYQEIDDNHESKYEPRRLGPPQVRIERKVFHPAYHSSSIISSTNTSQDMLDRPDSGHSATLPRHARIYSTSSDTPSPAVTLTPKTPPTPLTAFLPNAPPNSASTCPYARPHPSQMVSALATLPRRKKDNQWFFPTRPKEFEAHTIERSTRVGASFERSERGRARSKPPTPPMRRLPSWENRIYAIASVGMNVPESGNLAHRESSCPVTDGLYAERMYEDLSVPVYTTLKGKAAQIRSTPFTGDSTSESSDNDEPSPMSTSSSSHGVAEAVVSVAGPTGAKTFSSVTMRQQVNHSSSGATKRSVSTQSLASETSSDYAVPPDDDVSIMMDSSGDSEPEHKLLKYTADNLRKSSMEKSGYLVKLGGKVKSWRRKWFVFKNGELLYYKFSGDVQRRPQGHISLDGQTRIAKTEGTVTFEIVTSKKTYYLAAENTEDMEHWIRVLQNSLKKQAAERVIGQTKAKEIMKGWLIKTKHGRSRRCWCVLLGHFFIYYKKPEDKTPLGQIHLREARIEEVDRSCDSESDTDDSCVPDYTLAIWAVGQGPTYLMIPTKHEKDSWLYHLTVASGGGSGNLGTEYEQLISKLMIVDGDSGSVFWKHPTLLHLKEPILRPLTTLPSQALQERALELFKSCHVFMNVGIETQQLDVHLTLAQHILDTCLKHPELQNELYCQLVKQTSRHPPQQKSRMQNFLLCGSSSWFLCDGTPTSPTNSVVDLTDSKMNPANYVFVQGWQLLAMTISLFLPKQSVLWYLKAHLQRNADFRTDTGKYAVFCQRALERTLHNGGREARPSRMEVMSILLRNPYDHSQPISIPVHFLNGLYEVVSFDGSTTVLEFLRSLNKILHMRDCSHSGFALYTDDPAGQELEHCLRGHLKLCDVISKWEQAFFHHSSCKRRSDPSRTVRLTYKNRLYFKSLARSETEKEKLLLLYQVNEEILNGRFPVNRELALELAVLMAQLEYGDYRLANEVSHVSSRGTPERTLTATSQQQLPQVIDRFYPKRYRDLSPSDTRFLGQKIANKWLALRGRTTQECVRIYLTVSRKWPFFGAKLFSAKAKTKYGQASMGELWLAIQEDSVSMLDYVTLKPLVSYNYGAVVVFGGYREDFMLVVSEKFDPSSGRSDVRTERLLFALRKPKVLEMTMLMASYINSRGQHRTERS